MRNRAKPPAQMLLISRRVPVALVLAILLLVACTAPPPVALPSPPDERPVVRDSEVRMNQLIPKPAAVTPRAGVFTFQPVTTIHVEPHGEEMLWLGQYLAERLGPATGYQFVVQPGGAMSAGNVWLTTSGADPALGEEGYELIVTPDGVMLRAHRPAGVFRGIQTLRQLLPPAIELQQAQPGAWELPAVEIRDVPRFAWRGAMLDVARHFFGVADVKRFIDLLALYKMNVLHLHLSDDQGWRIEIQSWPNLALYGGSTQVGGGAGGYYTQAEYADIVAYAARRYIIVVPEIDMPGHTNAALASYAELNCDGVARTLYSGVEVGFSALCVESDTVYQFVDDVVRELAALTPGPYMHIGGDEVQTLDAAAYAGFIERAQAIVQAHGKRMIGWEEVAHATLSPTSVVQSWRSTVAAEAVRQGAKVIMSPASRTYLDMKYDPNTPLGLSWAGLVEVQDAYAWDPATLLEGVGEQDILGVEAPLWTETIATREQMDSMVFPRLLGIAEIGWSPAHGRSWEEYRLRLAAHGPRLAALGVAFYRSPQVPW